MSPDQHDVRRAAALRDLAERRVRRTTVAVIAGATALTGIFAGLAAASTHSAKRVVRPGSARTVTAPAPALVPNGAAPQAPSSQSQVQPPAAAPPSSAPVVSSGGS